MSLNEDPFEDQSTPLPALLHDLIDGTGATEGRAALADHVRGCPSCRTWLERFLAGAGTGRPEGIAEIVWADESPGAEIAGPVIPSRDDGTGVAESSAIGTKLDDLREQFGRLASAFEDKIRFDAGREAVIDRLHAELQEYKSDLVLKILRPMALEIIGLHDDVGKMIEARTSSRPEGDPGDPAAAVLAGLRDDIEDMLYRSGFETFASDRPEFDPKCQRVVRSLPTTEPGLDRIVAERLRKGFTYQGRVIRPEMVNVYVGAARASSGPATGRDES